MAFVEALTGTISTILSGRDNDKRDVVISAPTNYGHDSASLRKSAIGQSVVTNDILLISENGAIKRCKYLEYQGFGDDGSIVHRIVELDGQEQEKEVSDIEWWFKLKTSE
jgi:hypothetical protein